MADLDAAVATQLRNIEQSTGRTVAEWSAVVTNAGPQKHGEIVAYLKATHGLTHGNANLLAHRVRELAAGGAVTSDDLLEAQYAGAKATLRPTYEAVVAAAGALGPDVDIVIQKTGVALRRRKQFGLVQAPSAKRIDLGLNLPSTEPGDRLIVSSGMCSHRVVLADPAELDADVLGWLRRAYDLAG
jgi:hypothetical protein